MIKSRKIISLRVNTSYMVKAGLIRYPCLGRKLVPCMSIKSIHNKVLYIVNIEMQIDVG